MSEKVPILSLTRKDFKVETYRASGPGGQHRNTTDSAVRITHPPSGAVATCCKNRSQHSNIRDAFKDLTNRSKFQKWLRMEILHKSGLMARIESEVDAMVCPANLKTEVQDEKGKWMEVELNE